MTKAIINPVNCVTVAACQVPISWLIRALATPCSVMQAPPMNANKIPLTIHTPSSIGLYTIKSEFPKLGKGHMS